MSLRITEYLRPLHRKLRGQKLDLFFSLLGREPAGSLLDVGGGMGITGEFEKLYNSFSDVTLVNLKIDCAAAWPRGAKLVAADGCALPFRAAAFDWVFSNAVIEHVGGWDRQKRFADEIRRVAAKGYFVATPNRYFPIEPHTLLPFYQFLSPGIQRKVVRLSPGYLTGYEEINLLSADQLRRLFPEGEVRGLGLPALATSLVAFCHAA